MYRTIKRNYTYLSGHRHGRWVLALTWGGLGLLTLMTAAYVPILLQHRDFVRACWEVRPN